MVDFKELLTLLANDFEIELCDLCFCVSTESFDFPFSFYVDETSEYLIVLVTDSEGREKLHLINKSEIVFIKIMYLDDLEILFDDEDNDNYTGVSLYE